MAAEQLEQILALLLQPDNAVIQQATAELKEELKQPAALSHLCHVMTHSQDPQIQQFASVLLRRRLSKHWKKIGAADQNMIKFLVLSNFQQQTDHKVSLGLAQLAAAILKNETLKKWPQVLQSIQHGAHSRDPHKCQMALLLLQSSLDLDPDQFCPYNKDILRLFHQLLNNQSQPAVLYYSLRSLCAMVGGLSSDEVTLMSSMMPKVIAAIRKLIHVNEVQASEAMEVFDELLETEVAIVVQHLSEVVNFCLEVASNQGLSDGLRVKALSCISYLIKLKSKAILKHKLLSPILNALFPIMSADPSPGQMDMEDELMEEIEDEAEVQSPKHFAVQVIDMLALYLAPEKLFPQLTPLMEPALMSPNPYHRKAGLMCLAVLAEGCGDHIRNKHLRPMLQVVCQALADDSQVVRNAALFALGQFSENLQPDIVRFSDEIMPLLLRYLAEVDLAHTTHLAKAYYALENFVENLADKIEPYLPALMERMLNTLASPGIPRAKELAISAIGAIAQAAKESLLPYFQAIMEHLTSYMLTPREDLRPIQIQSVETMAILANVLSNDIFRPLSEKCCQLGLDLCDRVDDPDLRRCMYSLFSSLANVMGDSITPYLPRITTLLIYSLKSTEGIKLLLDSEDSFLLFDDEEEEAEVEEESLTDEEDEEDEESVGMCVRSVFMDEKEDACIALGEIAVSVSMPFLPYIETSFQEISQLLPCPQIQIRKATFKALGQLIISLHQVCKQEPSEAHMAAFQKLVSTLLPVYVKGAKEDHEREVVMAILEVLAKVVKECKRDILYEPAQLTNLCRLVREVLEKKVACQDDEEDEDDDDDEQAEYDCMLIEYAGELIPILAEVTGGDVFAPYFAGFLPLLLNKMRPSCSTADKSFAVGIIAETVQGLERASSSFVLHLLPVLLGASHDKDQEVCSNAVFGLGVLVEHGREATFQHYPQILTLLSNFISQKKSNRVIDNVCGAIARMIMTNPGGMPVEQVFPLLLRALPLREDFEEYKTVYRCITFIYENDPSQVLQQISEIVRSSGSVLGCKNLSTEARNLLITLLCSLSARYPTEFQAAILANCPEVCTSIHAAIGSA